MIIGWLIAGLPQQATTQATTHRDDVKLAFRPQLAPIVKPWLWPEPKAEGPALNCDDVPDRVDRRVGSTV